MSDRSLSIEVAPTANATVELLRKLAFRQLAAVMDVDSAEEAAKHVTDVDFDVYTDGFVRFAEGDLVGVYPLYRATMTVKLRNDERGSYSGRLF